MSQTKAWIVAIEKYATNARPIVNDPLDIDVPVATWALRLTEFLILQAHVSRDNVILNFSLRERAEYVARLEQIGMQPAGATQAELRDSLESLRGNSEDVLLVYWVGHGIRDDDDRYLLCSDSSSPENLRALTADSILRRLRSAGFPGFQMGFFDVCAQHYSTSPDTLSFRERTPASPRQYFYFAASANQFAVADPERPGFSSEVLNSLRRRGQVPNEPGGFFQELHQSFETLQRSGSLQSRPFDWQYTKESGDLWSRPGDRRVLRLATPKSIILYDRGPQVNDLVGLIENEPNRRNRPLAFIVSGPDPEYHEALHERLSQTPLPNELLGHGASSCKPLRLALPEEEINDEARALDRMRSSLRRALSDMNVESNPERLPNGLTYIRVTIMKDRKLLRTVPFVRALLRILDEAKDLPEGKALCLAISVEWEPGTLEKWLGSAFGTTGMRWQAGGPIQKRLRKWFPEVAYSNVRFRVINTLASPQRGQARDWVARMEQERPGLYAPTEWDSLVRLAERLFGGGRSMPMRDLCDKFERLFE